MTERTVTFKGIDNKKFNYDIPYSIELVINFYPKIEEHLKLAPGANITLFVTLPTGKQYIFKPSDTIDSFIEKSKGGFVTIFVKAKPQPAQQPQTQAHEVVEHRRLPVLKPGEELHMVNSGNPEDIVIEGKKAGSTGGGLKIELGNGASIEIPAGHSLLRGGKKIGIQHVQTSGQTFGSGPVIRFESLKE